MHEIMTLLTERQYSVRPIPTVHVSRNTYKAVANQIDGRMARVRMPIRVEVGQPKKDPSFRVDRNKKVKTPNSPLRYFLYANGLCLVRIHFPFSSATTFCHLNQSPPWPLLLAKHLILLTTIYLEI